MVIVDNPNDKKEPEKETVDPFEGLSGGEAEEPTPNADAASPDDDLPDKFKGKSTAEVAKMYQELESRFGQQGNEVGELRKTLDQYILSQINNGTQTKQASTEDEEPVDIFTDPDKAVSKAISSSPEVKETRETVQAMQKQLVQQQLASQHPNYKNYLQSQDFQKWIEGSKIRQRMLVQADQNYDLEAADELFTEWAGILESKKKASQDIVDSERQERRAAVKKASTGTARGNPSGRSSNKILYRRDIIDLMKKDPARYEAMAPEIRKAYEEKRVR